ncbi:MAG: hypothetical protein A2289_00050 [Deltaproteobacteria bacterium RIFOXYA12_FULL_58_15]|nr:MAG: hypothetical protein A2289_00050 [Deltaproteobacteria bacterium RIFOXYA12_FULL_58_15]
MDANQLLAYLRQIGPSKGADLYRHLEVSQPVFSRIVRANAAAILAVGRARSSQYAARRNISAVGMTAPLYEVTQNGHTRRVAVLHAVEPRGYWVEPSNDQFDARFHEDLPYFLFDQRPAGYLGRFIPRRYPNLNVPDDITRWSADHCMAYFAQYGWSLPGNIIVGDRALERYVERAHDLPTVAASQRSRVYAKIADDVLAHGLPGSSAAGEQAKFLVVRQERGTEVLVKFSPATTSEVGQRWADLLVCEHLVHRVLGEHGFATVKSELLQSKGRLFLEVERFDRTEGGGRRGVLSALALDLELVGSNLTSWSTTMAVLERRGLVDKEALEVTRKMELFGQLIGNTDMHLGNLSVMADGERPTHLAPIYDMVPMLFAPTHDQIVPRKFVPPTPKIAHAEMWESVFAVATDFWSTVASDKRISDGFARIAKEVTRALPRFGEVAALLPS